MNNIWKSLNSNDDWIPFRSLEGKVRLILLVVWDPLRLFGINATFDEYDGYAAKIVELLEAGADQTLLTAHLSQISSENMGMGTLETRSQEVAKKLLTVYQIHWKDEKSLQEELTN